MLAGVSLTAVLTAAAAAARISPPLKGGEVWTDDRAPVEWLIDASLVKEAARR